MKSLTLVMSRTRRINALADPTAIVPSTVRIRIEIPTSTLSPEASMNGHPLKSTTRSAQPPSTNEFNT
jgi:hypothetical protein